MLAPALHGRREAGPGIARRRAPPPRSPRPPLRATKWRREGKAMAKAPGRVGRVPPAVGELPAPRRALSGAQPLALRVSAHFPATPRPLSEATSPARAPRRPAPPPAPGGRSPHPRARSPERRPARRGHVGRGGQSARGGGSSPAPPGRCWAVGRGGCGERGGASEAAGG